MLGNVNMSANLLDDRDAKSDRTYDTVRPSAAPLSPPRRDSGPHDTFEKLEVAHGAMDALRHLQKIQTLVPPRELRKYENEIAYNRKAKQTQASSLASNIFYLLDDPTSGMWAKIMSVIILLLILLSCVAFVVETLPQFKYPEYGSKEGDSPPIFRQIEIVCIAAFTVEYVLRIVTVGSVPETLLRTMGYSVPTIHRCNGPYRLKWLGWARSPLNVVDLLSILPFYIVEFSSGSGGGVGLSVLRVLRLTRVFRVFKLGKYAEGLFLFGKVIIRSLSALYLLFFFMLISTVLFGSMIYYAERGRYDQDLGYRVRPSVYGDGEQRTPFTSIPRSFWWVITTSTTVGYGDMVPTTLLGMLVGTVAMYFGILVLAMPLAIISSNFQQVNAEHQKIKRGHKRTRLQTIARLLELQLSLETTNAELNKVFGETTSLCRQYLQLELKDRISRIEEKASGFEDSDSSDSDEEKEGLASHPLINHSKLVLEEFRSMQEQMHSLLMYKRTVALRIKRIAHNLILEQSSATSEGSDEKANGLVDGAEGDGYEGDDKKELLAAAPVAADDSPASDRKKADGAQEDGQEPNGSRRPAGSNDSAKADGDANTGDGGAKAARANGDGKTAGRGDHAASPQQRDSGNLYHDHGDNLDPTTRFTLRTPREDADEKDGETLDDLEVQL